MRILIRFPVAIIGALVVATLLASGCSGGPQSGALPPGPMGAAPLPSASQNVSTLAVAQNVVPGVPLHVKNYTFWQQSGIATGVPASWAAAWATFAEIGDSTNARAFHAAGGKYAVAYTDPNYFITGPGYDPPGNYPESAFGHGSDGYRTHRPQGGGTEYYLLPNSTLAQDVYKVITEAIALMGGYNYVYADGVSDSLPESLYRMGPTPTEITSTTQYVDGMKASIALSALPVIINGYNNGDPMTEEREYIGAPKVAAGLGEACFTNPTAVVNGQQWIDMANALLATTARHVYAICGGRGALSDNRALRTYYLASWWLTYDENYSVSMEIMSSRANVYVFAEQQIVPDSPDTTVSNVSSLKWYTGAYVRRFDMCYYKGVAWGACAAVVNPGTTSVRIPTLPIAYRHSLALDNNNLYEGGVASLSTSVPTTLAPGTGVILVR